MVVTYEYYTAEYLGGPVPAADFPRYEARARDIVDQLIRYQEVPAWWQTLYKRAICAQIDYYFVYGLDLSSGGISAAGFTVGKVSVSGSKNGNTGSTGAASMAAPAARAFLEQTGLLNPAVLACGYSPSWGW